MAAPKGNRFWEARSSHGRNPKFESPEALWAACCEYFEWVEANPLWEMKAFSYQGEVTQEPIAKMRAMTITGLTLFLDVTLETWRTYRMREDLSEVVTRAEQIIYDQKFSGAAADLLNANIIARDLGLKEQSQVEDVTPDKEIAISAALVSRSYSTVELDAILDNLSDEEQIELLELLEEEENYRNTHLLYEFTPYSKQREFIDAGHDYPERCFMAGNQLGKSFTGAAEVAFHLTGRYPGTKGYPADGKYGGEWKGKRFYEPVVFWIGGETNETVTKTTQRILCGRIEENDEPGYGSIPKEDIISWKKSPFFPNLVDHLLVKHHTADGVEDGISICYFKPYSQGRARWQGDTIHGVWFDEEPPYSIYGEGLTRTNKYGQFSILTFTPLMGMSDVVTKFLKNPSKSQKVVNMTIYDAEHYTDEQKEQIIASYPEHEREARARGIPTMGSGRIFQIPEETIKCQPFECPDHFYVIDAQDFGWNHPQAHIQLWWDKDADVFYLARVWKKSENTAVQAWGAVKSWANKIPVAWPHDGHQHEKGGGEQLKTQYADAGFSMLPDHATFPDGGNSVESGISELRDLMLEGRFKVFNTCEPFFEEFRLYHRDENGKIVKTNDDVLDATRYGYMMRRFADDARYQKAERKENSRTD